MYHLAIKPISRSAGRSATAAAAYRAGSLVIDERTGEVHDYTRKSDIEHSEILVPAGSPAWATERVALWNAAEAAEKRKDARVARDYEVAIPKELTREQGIALVRDFAHRLVDAYGVAVDFNVHRDEMRNWDGSEKGWQGYHAHLLASTRQLGRDGFREKVSIELSDTKRKSLGMGDGAAEIARVREWWEIDANRHLEQANQAQRIDRRSLKDQGVDREPTVHLGPAVTLLERDGVPSRLGDLNRQIVAEGKTRLAQQREVSELRVKIEAVEARQVAESKAREVERSVEPAKPVKPAEAKKSKEAKEAVAKVDVSRPSAAEALEQVVRERDERVRRVIARAEQREVRRREAARVLLGSAPVAPNGMLAAFKEKGHRQALVAWNVAKELAARLAEQARQLVQRLREIAAPERVLAWARGKVAEEVKVKAPAAVVTRNRLGERGREPAAGRAGIAAPTWDPVQAARLSAKTLQPIEPQRSYSRLPIDEQVRAFKVIVDSLVKDRTERLERIERKAQQRQQRRELVVARVAALRPVKPTGLLAGFKQKDYDENLKQWGARARYVDRLVEQASKLKDQVRVTKRKAPEWALGVMGKRDPAFLQSVRAHLQEQQRQRLEKQRVERERDVEIKRSRNRDRGFER